VNYLRRKDGVVSERMNKLVYDPVLEDIAKSFIQVENCSNFGV
jgi:hypothetical protein